MTYRLSPRLAASVFLCGFIGLMATPDASAQLVQTAQLTPQQQAQQGIQQTGPGQILQREERDTRLDTELDRQQQLPPDVEEVQLDVPEAPKAPTSASTVQFQVNNIVVRGNTLITDTEIEPIIAPYEGRQLTLDQLSGVVDIITQMYRQRGYLTSQAYIPPQDIEDGVIEIDVMEGRR